MKNKFEFKFDRISNILHANNKIKIRKLNDIIPPLELLSNPSTQLLPNQVSAFNSIRYGLEICNKSFLELKKQLLNLMKKEQYDLLEFPYIFLNVWTIINHSNIIYKIIERIFPEFDIEKNLIEMSKTKNVRNSMQHLDHRLSQEVFENEFPIYGSLSWSVLNIQTNEMIITSIYSGNPTNKIKSTMPMNEFVDKSDLKSPMQQIEFSYVIAKKSEGFVFETINIKRVMSELNTLSKSIIIRLENIVKKYPDRHITDIMIKLIGKLEKK